MTARTIVADMVLGAAVLVVLGASAGILLMRDVYQKVHYVPLAGLIAPVIVGVAILIQSGWSVNSLQTWLAIALMVIATPFLSHATIRVARIRQTSDRTRR